MVKHFAQGRHRQVRFFQPSHSPELNPIERVWQDLKKRENPLRGFPPLSLFLKLTKEGLNNGQNHQTDGINANSRQGETGCRYLSSRY